MQLQIFIEPCIYRILADIKSQIKTKNKKEKQQKTTRTKTKQKQYKNSNKKTQFVLDL